MSPCLRFPCHALVALLVGCSAELDSDDPPPPSIPGDADATQDPVVPPPIDAGFPDSVADGGHEAGDGSIAREVCWYRDLDGDGVGGEEMRCPRPEDAGSTGWSPSTGDCDETDPVVSPAQAAYQWLLHDRVGWDYNCNGVDDVDPGILLAPESGCWGEPDENACYGLGFLPNDDGSLCGSRRMRDCLRRGDTCEEVIVELPVERAIGCN